MSLSIGIGGDVGYYERDADNELIQALADEVVAAAEKVLKEHDLHEEKARAGDYYTGDVKAGRELAGQWRGPGADGLGLRGKVTAWQLHRLYGEHLDPIALGRALAAEPNATKARRMEIEEEVRLGNNPHRHYSTPEERLAKKLAKEPHATPERIRQIELSIRPFTPQSRPFLDLTFSLPKSYSVLYAALIAAGRDEEAQKLLDAHHWAIDQCMQVYMREAGFSAKGHWGKTVGGYTSGERIAGHDWVYSFFDHRVSRCGDPQVHTHVLLLNKVLCADGKWRALDTATIIQTMARSVGALHERFMAEEAGRTLGLRFVEREDGFGWEVKGITKADMDLYSTRRRSIDPVAREMTDKFIAKFNREPNAKERDQIQQAATLATRPAKAHDMTFEQYVAQWEDHFVAQRDEHLASILDHVQMGSERPEGIHADWDHEQVIQMAMARVERTFTTWGRSELRTAISDLLPPYLGRNAAEELIPYLDALVDEAVSSDRVTTLHQPAAVLAPDSLRHERCWRHDSGRSVYEPYHVERYATSAQLGRETSLVGWLHEKGAPRVMPQDAKRIRGESQIKLFPDQARVHDAVLTSGNAVDVIIKPAGAGGSTTVAEIARSWKFLVGGDTFGTSNSKDSTKILAELGLDRAHNIRKLLTAREAMTKPMPQRIREIMERRYTLGPQTLLVVDEVSTVSDKDLQAIHDLAKEFGCKVVLVGDTEQTENPEVSSALRLMIQEREMLHLDVVHRFNHEWEGTASLGLRAREEWAIDRYDQYGRIMSGTREEMERQFVEAIGTDILAGKDSLAMTATVEGAAELESRLRLFMIEHGRIDPSRSVKLHNETLVSPGECVQGRLNVKQLLDDDLNSEISNRQVFVIDRITQGDGLIVRERLGFNDEGRAVWGEQRELPEWYVAEHLERANIWTVSAKQGRTAEHGGYTFVTNAMDWHALYTSITRAKEHNVLFVPVEYDGEGQPTERPVDVLAKMMQRTERDKSATEVQREELAAVTHLARLGPQYDNELLKYTRPDHEAVVAEVFGKELAAEINQDEAADAFYTLLRAVESEGHDIPAVLVRALSMRELQTAESVAKVMHWRIIETVGTVATREFKVYRYVDVVPDGDTPELHFLRDTAERMDQQKADLAERQMREPEAWAIKHLGDVPDDPVERWRWMERAGEVAGYRERYGVDDPENAIGEVPGRKAAEQRASWERAYAALGRPAANEDVARLSDGELLLRIHEWKAAERWMPPDVSQQLQTCSIAARDYADRAVRDRARGDIASAERGERLGRVMADRAAKWEQVAAARHEAERFTTSLRNKADAAQLELDRRHPKTAAEPGADGEHVAQQDRQHERERNYTIDHALHRARQIRRDIEEEREREQDHTPLQSTHSHEYDHGVER